MMNVSLMPADVNLEFYFHPLEIHKSEDDIKSLHYNNPGTLIVIVTKTNILKVFDCLGKTVIFSVNNFKEQDLTIISISWTTDSNLVYVGYEGKKSEISGVKKLNLNYSGIGELFTLSEVVVYPKLKEVKVYSLYNTDDVLFFSAACPAIYFLENSTIFKIFDDLDEVPECSFILRETNEPDSFFIFVKEHYMIFLLKESNVTHMEKSKFLGSNISEKNMNDEQLEIFQWVEKKLSSKLVILDLFSINTHGEISQITMNSNKNLVLINSTERVLRLFRYDFDSISMIKDYFDSVNKRKWINAYFYTFKANSSYQDLIVSALSDTHSLEFVFFQIETGNYLRRLEPYKYQCLDFICHYQNHFTLVLLSYKKVYNIIGYFVNNWGSFAPQLKYIEENIEFVEDEAYFDNFNNYLKKQYSATKKNEKSIKGIFRKQELTKPNLFFKYLPEEDSLSIQSQRDLQDLFLEFNEIFEVKK